MKLNESNAELKITAGLSSQFPRDPSKPQIVLSGRSNVGKSSLINCLLNRKNLARVSSEPGKTITVNFYEVDKKLYLVDLPGYGFAKRAPEDKAKWSALTDGYLSKEPTTSLIKLVVQLIDSRAGITRDDAEMLRWLNASGIPFTVVVTKTDKLNATAKKAVAEEIQKAINIDFGRTDVNVIMFSSLTKEGRGELWKDIISYAEA